MTSPGRGLSIFLNETRPKAHLEQLSNRSCVVFGSIICGSESIGSTVLPQFRGNFVEKRLSLQAIILIMQVDNRLLNSIIRKPKRFDITNVATNFSSDRSLDL